MSLRSTVRILRAALKGFVEHDGITLGSGLAFYTALSLAPLLVILAYATRYVGSSALQNVVTEITARAGPEVGNAVKFVLDHAHTHHTTGVVPGIVGLIGLLLSATGAFSQLHGSLNTIWRLHGARRNIVGEWLRSEVLSFIMMAAVAGVMLLSITINTVLNLLPHSDGAFSEALAVGQTLILYVLLFGFIFKVLPDAKVRWYDAILGALITSGLFTLGNFAIAKYIRHAGIGSIYGAAGSLFVFLVYVYYASLIVFFGAEVTHAFAQRHEQRRAAE
jgi:membrane protein